MLKPITALSLSVLLVACGGDSYQAPEDTSQTDFPTCQIFGTVECRQLIEAQINQISNNTFTYSGKKLKDGDITELVIRLRNINQIYTSFKKQYNNDDSFNDEVNVSLKKRESYSSFAAKAWQTHLDYAPTWFTKKNLNANVKAVKAYINLKDSFINEFKTWSTNEFKVPVSQDEA